MTKDDEIIAASAMASSTSEKPPSENSHHECFQFEDRTISVRDWVAETFHNIPGQAVNYFKSLFPIAGWIYRYNFTWLTGDVIAGLTVGAVVVPQGMSYALLATLPPEYGLYSSLIGVFLYCFFATSKDVTIGPVAVMSLETAKLIARIQAKTPKKYTSPEIATALALICGIVCAVIGFFRLGFILEFIPVPAVAGFMTGSAFTIVLTQVPTLLGISKRFNTRDAAYKVAINTLKNLKYTNLDAAFGFTALFSLYLIRWVCSTCERRYPRYRRAFFFAGVMRNGLVVIIVTIAAWLVTRHENPKNYRINILKTVPRGFKHVGVPVIDSHLADSMAPEIPVATIILLLEHIAIAKSFGRINDYKVIPDQEVIAIGITNVIGSFFGAYPATGSFSRTALKSKSGVRTPLAGIVTGIVVLLALYALTGAFYYIPQAGLAAVIIHAVGDLMSPPRQVYVFWRIQPLEAIIFLADVFITIFSSIENGIYFAIGASAALLLYRIARPRGQFLGYINLSDGRKSRKIYVPMGRRIMNPNVNIHSPPPGIVVFRPTESFTYPNASTQLDLVVDEIKKVTKRGKPNAFPTLGDRPWNDPGPRAGYSAEEIDADTRPILQAVVFDFAAVSAIDTTGIQCLVDIRRQINKYADRDVEFHFANIISPWVRRALLAAGFGTGKPAKETVEIAPIVPATESLKVSSSSRELGENLQKFQKLKRYIINSDFKDKRFNQFEGYDVNRIERGDNNDGALGPVVATDTPFFHLDIPDLSNLPFRKPQELSEYLN